MIAIDQVAVLADPADTRFFRDRLLENRCAVYKGPIAELANSIFDAACQRLQSISQYLVIVAAERVARNVGTGLVIQQSFRCTLWLGQVVHTDGNYPNGPRDERIRPTPFSPVAVHVVHRAVEVGGQPGVQASLGFVKIDIAYAELLESEFRGPVGDLRLEPRHIGIAVCVRGIRQCQIRAA